MKDFGFWHGALNNAKSPLILKSVGEELGASQKQKDLISEENKLTERQMETLRELYKRRMKKLEAERIKK